MTAIQKQIISQSCPHLESEVIVINERGLTSTVWTEYIGTVRRVRKSATPTSDTTAETVMANGFALWQTDHTGVTQRFSRAYRADGMLLETTDGCGNASTTQTDLLERTVRATKQVTENGNVTLHQRHIYRGYLQIACCDLTRANHPCLWLITWDPTQPVATRPLAIQKSGTWYCYGWDLTKNICEVFGSNGYINTIYTYTPYGEVKSSGSTAQPLQWSSEYSDTELNQVYFNYRHYSSVDGRWTVRDRLSEIDNKLNLYDYLANIPLKNIDILGDISYVQIDKTFGHAWIRLGAFKKIDYRYPNHNVRIYGSIPAGIGFYPVKDKNKLLYIIPSQGKWQAEEEKEIYYALGYYAMDEYQLKIYSSFWYTPKLKYGETKVPCKCSTEEQRIKCLDLHPEGLGNPSNYNLIFGNCRDRAKEVLRDCCWEIDSSTKTSAIRGYIKVERLY